MKIFITGGAGFIGSNLAKKLFKNNQVTIYDNFSVGKRDYLPKSPKIRIIAGDVLDKKKLTFCLKDHDVVYHFAANSDVRKGTENTALDLEQNTLGTFSVLEAMKVNNVSKVIFPSSMTVYGLVTGKPVSESYGPCLPISLYGAAKLADEAMISAFCELYGIQSYIFRFANIIGVPSTHGVIHDFIQKLLKSPNKLEVLGDGNQRKPYIYIDDAIDAVLYVLQHKKDMINLFNVGTSDSITVEEISQIIIKKMKLKGVVVQYTATAYGWKGDVPEFSLDISKLLDLGFKPLYSAKEAVRKTIKDIIKQVNYDDKTTFNKA